MNHDAACVAISGFVRRLLPSFLCCLWQLQHNIATHMRVQAMTISAPPAAKTPMAQVSGPWVELNLLVKYLHGVGIELGVGDIETAID